MTNVAGQPNASAKARRICAILALLLVPIMIALYFAPSVLLMFATKHPYDIYSVEHILSIDSDVEWVRFEYAVTDDDINKLPRLSRLEDVSLVNAHITDDGITILLEKAPTIKRLDLAGTLISGVSIHALSHSLKLTYLRLDGCERLTDEDFRALTDMPSLTTINLDNTSVSASGLSQLERLPQLSYLSLRKCVRVNDEALLSIRRIKTLKHLALTGTSVTEAGLTTLEGMDYLNTVHLTRDAYSDNAVSRLREQLLSTSVQEE